MDKIKDRNKQYNLNSKVIMLIIKFMHPELQKEVYGSLKIDLNETKTKVKEVEYSDNPEYMIDEDLNKEYLCIDMGKFHDRKNLSERIPVIWFKDSASLYINEYKLKIELNKNTINISIKKISEDIVYIHEYNEDNSRIKTLKSLKKSNRRMYPAGIKGNAVISLRDIKNGIYPFSSEDITRLYEKRLNLKVPGFDFIRDNNLEKNLNNIAKIPDMKELINYIYREIVNYHELRDFKSPRNMVEENKTELELEFVNILKNECLNDLVGSLCENVYKSTTDSDNKSEVLIEKSKLSDTKHKVINAVKSKFKNNSPESLDELIVSVIEEIIKHKIVNFNYCSYLNNVFYFKLKGYRKLEINMRYRAYYDNVYKRINIKLDRISMIDYNNTLQLIYYLSLYGYRLDLN